MVLHKKKESLRFMMKKIQIHEILSNKNLVLQTNFVNRKETNRG